VKTTRLIVNHKEKNTPLRDFLAARLNVSGREAKRLLDERRVFVNRRRVWMARHALAERDAVEIERPPAVPPGRLPVLYEDADYVIVDKPPGILSEGPGSVETRLRRAGRPEMRAVHRLDRDTSGCLWLAAGEPARQAAVELFRTRGVRKTYHAVAAGRVTEATGRISAPVDGESAVTEFRVLDANGDATHLALRIETGRTHQIRKHLAGMGHPVLGDRTYWGRHPQTPAGMRVARQMLHARRLDFIRPRGGARVTAAAPLPRDFRACLALFRLT